MPRNEVFRRSIPSFFNDILHTTTEAASSRCQHTTTVQDGTDLRKRSAKIDRHCRVNSLRGEARIRLAGIPYTFSQLHPFAYYCNTPCSTTRCLPFAQVQRHGMRTVLGLPLQRSGICFLRRHRRVNIRRARSSVRHWTALHVQMEQTCKQLCWHDSQCPTPGGTFPQPARSQ